MALDGIHGRRGEIGGAIDAGEMPSGGEGNWNAETQRGAEKSMRRHRRAEARRLHSGSTRIEIVARPNKKTQP